MNILLLTQFLSTTKGGGEAVFTLMANTLADRGHNVWIITHKIEDEDYTHFHKNVKIHFVSPVRYEGGLPPAFSDNIKFVFQGVSKGAKLIKNHKIQLIHSNNFSPAVVGSILSSLTRKPHVTTVHDIFSLCGKNYWQMWGKQSNISRLNVLLAPIFEKWMIKLNHNAIHTVSTATYDDLIKFGASKPIHIIENSIDFIDHENVEAEPLQFVYVGRLVFYKNLETIIRAVKIVKKSHDKIKLKIVGGGPHKENLLNLTNQLGLQENIEFCGYVPEETKYKIISSSTAMVFPSLCEGFGLVILESFSCNRPVIVSDIKPLSDIIENEKNGLVVQAKDENGWAEAMIFLIRNKAISHEMGQEGKKKLVQQYNKDIMVSKIESMYQQVISSN